MNQFFVEQAPTLFEAERKAREKYGERLTILTHETVKIPGGFLGFFPVEGVKITGIIPSFGRGQHRESLKEPYPSKPTIRTESTASKESTHAALNAANAEQKEKILAVAGKDNAMKEVLAEVKSIKEKLENQGLVGSREEHPTLNRIDDLLILNDFPLSYRKTLLERVRKEISLEGLNNFDAVQDRALEWIGESVKIYDNDKFNVRPRIMILVGPTGVGKTTTIAKLAANFGIDDKARQKRRIVVISIDAYRIMAKEQLEKYIRCMEFPFFPATDYDEMKKVIALNSEAVDLILIDTIGRNPRDMVQLGEMKQLLNACGTLAEFHLVAASTTKSSDLKEILQQFDAFNYRSVVITKMDETIHIGNVIGALAEKGKPISYVTNGQGVPGFIQKASVVQFLINMEGFRVNRIKMEEKFPDKGREQMQQWR